MDNMDNMDNINDSKMNSNGIKLPIKSNIIPLLEEDPTEPKKLTKGSSFKQVRLLSTNLQLLCY